MKCNLFFLFLTVILTASCAEGDTSAPDGEAGASPEGGGGEDVEGGGGTGGEPETGGEGGLGGTSEGGFGGGEGGSGGGPDPICMPDDTRCTGLDVETCNSEGSGWNTTEVCPFSCTDGTCEGECSSGASQCNGDDVETCDASGSWTVTSSCPFVCSNGACTGVCEPGDVQCTTGNAALSCDSTGQWTFVEQCPILCSAGTCTGSCTPGTHQCAGDTAQVCDSQGQWTTAQVCDHVCTNGVCVGVCDPGSVDCQGDVPRTCSAQGQWVTGSACPFLCSAGTCTGVCEPGDVQCSGTGTQTCQANGQWSGSTGCPDQPNSSPICSGSGVCGFTCDFQFANCDSGQPGCETQLGTVQNCMGCGDTCGPAPANAVSTCTAQGCGFTCLPGWDDCDGNPANGCELNTTSDDWNCGGCGIGCFGGTCTNSVCECDANCQAGITKVADASNVTSLTAKNVTSLFLTSGDSVSKVSKSGGTTTVLTSNEHSPRAVIANATKVFWSNTDPSFKAVRSMTTAGASLTTIASGHAPVDLALDGTNLFWTDQTATAPCFCSLVGQSLVFKLALSGGSPTLVNSMLQAEAWQSWPGIVASSNRVYRLRWKGTTAATDLYYQDQIDPSIHGPISGGANFNGQDANSYEGKYLTLTPNGSLVYYSKLNTTAESGIVKLPYTSMGLGAGEAVATLPGTTVVKDLVADDSYVYIIVTYQGENWDRLLRFPMNGSGMPEYLANFQYQAANLEIDSTHIYWTIEGIKPGTSAPVEGGPTIVKLMK